MLYSVVQWWEMCGNNTCQRERREKMERVESAPNLHFSLHSCGGSTSGTALLPLLVVQQWYSTITSIGFSFCMERTLLFWVSRVSSLLLFLPFPFIWMGNGARIVTAECRLEGNICTCSSCSRLSVAGESSHGKHSSAKPTFVQFPANKKHSNWLIKINWFSSTMTYL